MTDPRRLDPEVLGALMRGFHAPWCIAGGWALDLFLGRETRPHADVDVALFRGDQLLLRHHFVGWTFEKVLGGVLERWEKGEWLHPPIHEVHARSGDQPSVNLEFLLNERTADRWVFRRNPEVSCPLDRVILQSGAGLPVLCPAVVLLYKAKAPRTVDELDFTVVRGNLDAEQLTWLESALRTCHPGHRWLARL